mgnify:CR=1 FL=1
MKRNLISMVFGATLLSGAAFAEAHGGLTVSGSRSEERRVGKECVP